MIPRIIHYCWFGSGKMKHLEIECIASWKRHLPDYKIMVWNESNFNYHEYPFAMEAYEQGKFAFVADVARLYALYTHGGIYMDTDMLVLKSMDTFLKHPFFIGEELPGVLSVGIVGCEAGNEVIEKILNSYRSEKYDAARVLTIPNQFKNIIESENLKSKIISYPPEYFYPLPLVNKKENYQKYITENTFAVHLWNHSWKDEFSSLKNYFFGESLGCHVANLITFKKEYWRKDYLFRYYREFYYRLKVYIFRMINPS